MTEPSFIPDDDRIDEEWHREPSDEELELAQELLDVDVGDEIVTEAGIKPGGEADTVVYIDQGPGVVEIRCRHIIFWVIRRKYVFGTVRETDDLVLAGHRGEGRIYVRE